MWRFWSRSSLGSRSRLPSDTATRWFGPAAPGTGSPRWTDCDKRLRAHNLSDGLYQLARWPSSTPPSHGRHSFLELVAAVEKLAADLQHREPQPVGKKTPRSFLFDLLVQIRNKTVHGAYDSRFYADHVGLIEPPVMWVLRETPLWD